METQKGSTSLQWWSLLLLLLGLVVPPAAVEAFSYQEAVLRAVDGFNQRSSNANLFRLLKLDQQPDGDEDPDTPKPVSFTVKETVCPRKTQRPPEQCDFKENGLVKQCVGTVTLDQTRNSFDITCDRRVKRSGNLGRLIRKGGEKIGKKIERVGQRIKEFFEKLAPTTES
ncbi:cathelicidin antimicrobial peptide isoform X2 [Trichechus manatus latirostris]|uniref:Cathelicidin antimicrobial peptide isoform X2 n=1 Tax=Trichechus manatus latirostris TaxID=127582 RepID=A0A2Y9R4G3_TRIMA|nr:cathelicidin antimicrobial peptide isoform X2 [Trichechus manatus latirostris]